MKVQYILNRHFGHEVRAADDGGRMDRNSVAVGYGYIRDFSYLLRFLILTTSMKFPNIYVSMLLSMLAMPSRSLQETNVDWFRTNFLYNVKGVGLDPTYYPSMGYIFI